MMLKHYYLFNLSAKFLCFPYKVRQLEKGCINLAHLLFPNCNVDTIPDYTLGGGLDWGKDGVRCGLVGIMNNTFKK